MGQHESLLCVIGRNRIREANQTLRQARTKPEVFESLLSDWGPLRYSHRAFVKDFGRKKLSNSDGSLLGHALLRRFAQPYIPTTLPLHQAFLDGTWFPSLEDDEGFCKNERLQAFLDARRGGRPDRTLLSRQVISDLGRIRRLCGRVSPKVGEPTTRFPVWLLRPSPLYEGYLTSRDMRTLSPNNSSGFCGYVQRLMAYSSRPTELEGVLKALAHAREQMIALGAGAVCISVVGA